jgi:hypothetical protein
VRAPIRADICAPPHAPAVVAAGNMSQYVAVYSDGGNDGLGGRGKTHHGRFCGLTGRSGKRRNGGPRVEQNHSRSERMAYDPAARAVERIKDPHDPKMYPDAGLRAAWALGALFVVMVIVAVISLSSHRSATSSAATGSTTQSAPRPTGQGGAPNTGAAR